MGTEAVWPMGTCTGVEGPVMVTEALATMTVAVPLLS